MICQDSVKRLLTGPPRAPGEELDGGVGLV
jgi:hypothetical protein